MANPLKCIWGAHSLEYLEHHVGMDKVRVTEVRVRAMKDYFRPTSKRVEGIPGDSRLLLVIHARFFPEGWSLVRSPEKGIHERWFCLIDECFVMRAHINNAREHDQLLVQTDASMEGIGAVLEAMRIVQWHITPKIYLQRRKTTRSLSLSVWRWLGWLTTSTCMGITSHWWRITMP